MYIVTFYSYRGGVGRTTALVNVGLELARRGRKVLLVDFDLEKPDLPNFPSLARAVGQRGIVEYVSAYRESGIVPNIQEYLCPLGPAGTQGGRIWVMPAGKSDSSEYWSEYLKACHDEDDWVPKGKGGPEYWQTLAGIDWQTLYDQEQGYLFFEKMREQWQKLEVDYVLIDTHAGITPSLGITTRQLADAVVMMYNPHQEDGNKSNGVRMRAGLDDVSWLIDSEAEQTGRKPIEQFFVASQVLDTDKEIPDRFFELDYENEIGIFVCAAAIPFSQRLQLGESVIEQEKPDLGPNLDRLGRRYSLGESDIEQERQEEHPREERKRLSKDRLAREYRRLANEIIKANLTSDPDGARVILYDFYRNPRKALRREGYAQLEQIINGFQERNAEILALTARCLWRSKRKGQALVALGNAIQLCPDAPELLLQRASYLREMGDPQRAIEDLMHLLDVLDPQRQPPASTLRPELPVEFRGEREWSLSLHDPLVRWQTRWGINRYVVSALRQLRELSPEKFEEAKKKPCITRLSQKDQDELSAPTSGPETQKPKGPRELIRTKKWKEVVDLLQPRLKQSEDGWSLEDTLHLFMAYWALGDDKSLRRCGEKATGRFQELRDSDLEIATALPMLSIVYWKTEERAFADEILTHIEWDAEWPEEEGIFSYWRYERIAWELFKEDCIDIRQMLRGAKILPPVLEPEPAHC